jgi:hypothetical protein
MRYFVLLLAASTATAECLSIQSDTLGGYRG